MLNTDNKKRELFFLAAAGVLTGLVCFLLTYGVRVLDVTYDAWIFYGDTDLKQHYLGWCHYRTSPWTFPLGMIDSLSYPTSVSMIYTDSIPLFAFLFKLLRDFLPDTFQYFGWFAFLSFGLQGGLAALLVKRVTKSSFLAALFPAVFVWSFPILHRTFYHTSLCAQWLILLCLYVWFSGAGRTMFRKIMIWTGIGALCVLIHSYFLPMAGVIMCAALLEEVIREKKWKGAVFGVAGFCAGALLMLVLFGAFSGGVSPDYGIGGFEMNLLSFVNSMGHGLFLPDIPLFAETQYEGFCYLGMGVLVLALLASVSVWRGRSSNEKSRNLREYVTAHPRRALIVCVAAICILAATCPGVAVGKWQLFRIPYPRFVNKIVGIFRSNGRFGWPVVYIIMICAIAAAAKNLRQKTVRLIALGCVLLQLLDVMPYVMEKREVYFAPDQKYASVWDFEKFNDAIDRYSRFVMMFNNNDLIMTTAYYAYEKGLTLNRYYYARDIDSQIEENLRVYEEQLLTGQPADDIIYLFDKETMDQYADSGLHFYALKGKGWFFGTKAEIGGMEEYDGEMDAAQK